MGEVRTGIVVDKRPHELLIDIGFKSEGVVNGRELERVSEEFAALKVGDEIPVYVLREDKDGNVLLSISHALAEQDWERAEGLMQSQNIFEGIVEAFNGGVSLSAWAKYVALCLLANSMPPDLTPVRSTATARMAKAMIVGLL